MIVHFSASARNLKGKIEVYRRIQNRVRLLGHSFHNDWVETAWYRESNKLSAWDDIVDIVRNVAIAIKHADILIAEASDASVFGVGYEVSLALQQNKPILILVDRRFTATSYAKGLKHELVTYGEYDDTTLDEVIEKFLKENTIANKDLRFNFVMDRRVYNHLRSKSFETGKTKAEVLRDLLIKDIRSASE